MLELITITYIVSVSMYLGQLMEKHRRGLSRAKLILKLKSSCVVESGLTMKVIQA